MRSLWTWISRVCRQKRILILLCTFGSSFLVFNYSLLSFSTTNAPTTSFSNNNKVDHDDSFTVGILQQQKFEEFGKIQEHEYNHRQPMLDSKVRAPSQVFSLPSSSPTLALSRTRGSLSMEAKNDTISTFFHNREKTFIRNRFHASSSLSVSQASMEPLLPPVSKHAQKSFTLPHKKATRHNPDDDHSKPSNMNTRINEDMSRVNFLNAIGQNYDNNNNNNIPMTSNFQKGNNGISTRSFHFSKNISNRVSKPIDDNDNANTDEKRQPTAASSSKAQSEIIEESITISSSKNENMSGGADIRNFPMLSNSIQPSLTQLSSELFSPAPPLESSSHVPHKLSSFYTSHRFMGRFNNNNSSNSNHLLSSALPKPITTTTSTSSQKSNLRSPFQIPPCNTTFQLRRIQKRKKNLTVIENFIMGWQHVKCNETITYTTHGDYRYLDNLVPLVDRWKGPVSVAIYCPGEDLEKSLELISYLKLCTSSNINKWATFHLIYDTKLVKRPVRNYTKPGDIPWLDILYQEGKWKDCSQKPTFSKGNYTFRIRNGLLYPINIARNIARAAAVTYFVLASDIELYPSINLIPSFMEMLHRLQKVEEGTNNYAKKNNNKFTAAAAAVMAKFLFSGSSSTTMSDGDDEITQHSQSPAFKQHQNREMHGLSGDLHPQQRRHVFVLPVFEVKKEIVPCQVETKEQLTFLLKNKSAVLFHHSICPFCHIFPRYEEWKMLSPGIDDGAIKDFTKKHCNGNDTSGSNGAPEPEPSSTLLRIFHKAKRKHPYQLWEPIFIGTKVEPIYDERLSWEGLRDKMVSGYIMCALDYDFYILDNAFLVHKPGIRRVNHLVTKTVMSQDRLINYRIRSELLKKFGKHDECAL